MKRDTEIIRDILVWLLSDPDPNGTMPSGDAERPWPDSDMQEFAAGEPNVLSESWDPLDSEILAIAELEQLNRHYDSSVYPVPSLGDIPAVQDRFQSLIKRRLRLEIERRPPLFPWETETQDYPEYALEGASEFWLTHLRRLPVPTTLPDELLTALLERCQDLAQKPLKSGVKLVQAVQGLFPNQPEILEQIASFVLNPAYRGEKENLPSLDYDQANTQQRIALAMLAVQDILSSLTLSVSADQPVVTREWFTEAGVMTLRVEYQPQAASLQVQAVLPTGGYLASLDQDAVRTERVQPGVVTLSLTPITVGQPYSLEVGLTAAEAAPLRFVVTYLDESLA